MRRGIGLTTVIVSACVMLPGPTAVGAPTARPRGPSLRSAHVAVDDFYFDPATRRSGVATRSFDFVGGITHTATDSSGLELFDSGNVPPGRPEHFVHIRGCRHLHVRLHAPCRHGRARLRADASGPGGRWTARRSRSSGRPRRPPATTSTTCRSDARGATWTSWRSGVMIAPRLTFEPPRRAAIASGRACATSGSASPRAGRRRARSASLMVR